MRHEARSAFFVRLQENFAPAPNLLKVVVLAHGGLKHVADDAAAVNEHPFARILTLHADDVAPAAFTELETEKARARVWRFEVPEAMTTRSN